MGALLALVPTKDWIYGGIIAALLAGFGWYTIHERHEGASHEVAALQTSSAKLQAAAAAQVQKIATAYAASTASTTEKLNAQIQAANVQHDSDAQRLREYDAYRSQYPAFPRAASVSGPQSAGNGSAVSVDNVLARLEQVSLVLATADRKVTAALTACMADRDSLTDK